LGGSTRSFDSCATKAVKSNSVAEWMELYKHHASESSVHGPKRHRIAARKQAIPFPPEPEPRAGAAETTKGTTTKSLQKRHVRTTETERSVSRDTLGLRGNYVRVATGKLSTATGAEPDQHRKNFRATKYCFGEYIP
jgi:hypothetical protein